MSFPVREDFRPGEDDQALMVARDGFFEDVAASFSAARRLDNFNARTLFEDEIWSERLAEVEAAAGVRMQHPGSLSARAGRYIEGMMFPESAPENAGTRQDGYAHLESRIEALRQSSPELAEAIRPAQFWRDEMGRRAQVLDSRADQSGFWAALTGGVGAAFTDPVNLATAPLGAGASASRSLGVAVARAAGIEAAINTALEGANIPVANRWRQELGLDAITADEAKLRLGAAALFGGALGAGTEAGGRALASLTGRTLADGLDALAPDDPLARSASARLDEDARLADANPFDAGPEADALHRSRAQDAETVLRAPGSPEARLAAERLAAPLPDTAIVRVLTPIEAEQTQSRFALAYAETLASEEARLSGVIEALQDRLARDQSSDGVLRALLQRRDPGTLERLDAIAADLDGANSKRRAALERELEQITASFDDEVNAALIRRAGDRDGLEARLQAAREELRQVSAVRRRATAPARPAVQSRPEFMNEPPAPRVETLRAAPPPSPDAVDDAPAARRAQVQQLADAAPAARDQSYDADLFEIDEGVRTGRAVSGEEIETQIAADLSAIERFRGCVA